MPPDQFFRTRIFEPLGMRDTYFAVPANKRDRLVTLHTIKDGKLLASHKMSGGIHTGFPARTVTCFSGGGGLSSTSAPAIARATSSCSGKASFTSRSYAPLQMT